MKSALCGGHVFVYSGDQRHFDGPGIVFIFIACPTPPRADNVNSDPTTECGSSLGF